MRIGICKKRLAATATTLAMALSNLSGLALDAGALTNSVREYRAELALNNLTEAELGRVKVSELMSMLTNTREVKGSGETPASIPLRIEFRPPLSRRPERKWRRHPDLNRSNRGFAVRCLTTWLWRHWSGQRDSNSLPPPWQGGALPNELCPHMVPQARIELATRGFSVRCSTY